MNTSKSIKDSVKEKYGKIANGETNVIPNISSCCSSKSCCSNDSNAVIDMTQRYTSDDKNAIPDGADLGLGCGTPAAYADMRNGMTILDLGSGAGVDCFIASKYVGELGKVIGVDMTEEMIRKANENKAKVNVTNVDFRLGEIESLPVENNSIDRVISNCVINLVPDKRKAFSEIFRVLKTGGKFTVSDIVVDGSISEKERQNAALWAGCISGALSRKEYLEVIELAGFKDIKILSEKKYDYILQSGGGLYSITVSGTK
ncbi:MAG: arsenite methyltransferase [Ignavibacteriales bacterium]|nr:arsenite methyltransferase [Ignavibacteriales bacterium]